MDSNEERAGKRRPQSSKGRRGSPGPDSLVQESSLSFEERLRQLTEEMAKCLDSGETIDLSTRPHRVITEALHRLVYAPGGEAGLKVSYGDGSKAKKFPVRSLRLPDTLPVWDEDRALNVGTLTFRHVDYDKAVDLYLIRDRETRRLNSGEVHALAYERMGELLSDPRMECDSYLTFYQTGLEPLVVGAYHALVEHIRERSQNGLGGLVVRPVFYARGRNQTTGTLWA